jgi:hypothetical protein
MVSVRRGGIRHQANKTEGKLRKKVATASKHIKRCYDTMPVFKCDVDIAELHARTKNTATHLAVAKEKMEKMRGLQAQAMSGRFVDKNGKTILAYFSNYHKVSPSSLCPSASCTLTYIFTRRLHLPLRRFCRCRTPMWGVEGKMWLSWPRRSWFILAESL